MEEEITKIILDEQLNKINTNIYLTNKQIELDEIASQISEFDYYNNINK